MLWCCKSKKFGTVGKYPLELQGVNTPCKQMNPNLSYISIKNRKIGCSLGVCAGGWVGVGGKISPGGLGQFDLSLLPVARYSWDSVVDSYTTRSSSTTTCLLS